MNLVNNLGSKWKKCPTFLRLNILDYMEDSPSTLLAKRIKESPSYGSLKHFNSYKVIGEPSKLSYASKNWVLIRCIYCRGPKGWAKKTNDGSFYYFSYFCGCNC
jgi:hypothetical protein